MRLLRKGKCKRSEVRLAWNQQGLQGPQGIQGESGPQGAKGDSATAPDAAIYARKAEVVPRTLTTQPLQATPLPAETGSTVLVPGPADEVASAPELIGMTARSYTRKYEIPANWAGFIDGRCPADAPVPLTYGVYALDENGEKFGENGWPPYGFYTLGSRARIDFTEGRWPALTLFVTQVCGPITGAVVE
jgi:hypothetical protein